MLGVVLHSSQVFNPAASWVIHNALETTVAAYVVDAIHLFRLPAFFMVSGYFFLRSLRKYGVRRLLKLRGERILVPLIVSAATLNCIQAFLLDSSGWRHFEVREYLFSGRWLSHLWFLYYLFAYYLIACFVMRYAGSIPGSITRFCSRVVEECHMVVILSLWSVCQILLLLLGKALPVMYFPIPGFSTLYNLAFYLQFFVFGAFLCRSRTLITKFVGLSPLFAIPMLVTTIVVKMMLIGNEGILTMVLSKYLGVFTVWLSCSLCFFVFKTFADRPSKTLSFFANASYTVYLFHHLLVVAFGLLFIHWGIGGLLGLTLLMLTVFLLSSLIHVYIVSNSELLTYLYNGRRKKTHTATLATDAAQT